MRGLRKQGYASQKTAFTIDIDLSMKSKQVCISNVLLNFQM